MSNASGLWSHKRTISENPSSEGTCDHGGICLVYSLKGFYFIDMNKECAMLNNVIVTLILISAVIVVGKFCIKGLQYLDKK